MQRDMHPYRSRQWLSKTAPFLLLVLGLAHGAFAQTTVRFGSAPQLSATTSGSSASIHAPAAPSGPVYYDPYAHCPSDVRIDEVDFATEYPGDLLMLGAEPYISDDSIDVRLRVAQCNRLERVTFRGIELLGASAGIDDSAASLELLGREPAGPGEEWISFRIHTSNLGTGSRLALFIEVGSPRSSLLASWQGETSWVAAIQEDTWLPVREEDLHNSMIAQLFATVGSFGTGSLPGSSLEIYDMDYGRSFVDVVPEVGVDMHWEFKLRVPGFCDPTVHIDGTFAFQIPGSQVELYWAEPIQVDVDFPHVCGVFLEVLFLEDWVDFFAQSKGDEIEEALAAGLGGNGCGLGCIFVADPEYVEDEVRFPIRATFDRVAINLLYDAARPEFGWTGRVHLPEDRWGLLLVSGTSDVCKGTTERAADCEALRSGPAGLENFHSDTPSVPLPWELYGQRWAFYEERLQARSAMLMPSRPLDQLPAPDHHVGVPLVRRDAGALLLADRPCVVRSAVGGTDLGFGVNDMPGPGASALGSGKRRLNVFLLTEAEAEGVPACFPANPPINPQSLDDTVFPSTTLGSPGLF